ncbi:MAG: hypothetical protein K2V38_25685, partial [Gemmataceae bacterium]|nr:hypothetical protein [Gemmataceae bacterium]
VEILTEAMRGTNPFCLLCYYLSDEVRQRLAALAFPLPVPPPDEDWHRDWAKWWDLCQDEISDEQRSAAWDVLRGMPPFEVVEVEVGDG